MKREAERRAAAQEFSGALLVAKDGKPIVEGAYGGNDIDTRFRFGSMGKMFTAVAALQLIQAGKIALDAPISKYLPDYPNKEVAAVTIEQLLTHTGGTGNIFSPEYFDRRLETREHQDYLKLFGNRGPMFHARLALGLQQLRHDPARPHHRGGQRAVLLRVHARSHLRTTRHDRNRQRAGR